MKKQLVKSICKVPTEKARPKFYKRVGKFGPSKTDDLNPLRFESWKHFPV